MISSWEEFIGRENKKDCYKSLVQKLRDIAYHYQIFPPPQQVFSAFKLTPLNKIKVVIIGQDPYSNFGQAHGLAFSVLPGIKIPPSLKIYLKKLKQI